jgi:hypothetical protein
MLALAVIFAFCAPTVLGLAVSLLNQSPRPLRGFEVIAVRLVVEVREKCDREI